jgi:hypothetical protein
MGGKGELVLYERIKKKVATARQRKKLKEMIGDMIDQTSTTISIIALVEVESEEGAATPAKRKQARRGGRKRGP